MARTANYYLQHLLEHNWTASIPGRVQDVPQPNVALVADIDLGRVNVQSDDWIFIHDGRASVTPRSVGWDEKRYDTDATIDIRTAESRARLEGTRNDQNEKERLGGIRGEVERILDSVRRGDKEFDWVNGYEYRNLSEEMGYANWRGVWEVELTELAHTIDTST